MRAVSSGVSSHACYAPTSSPPRLTCWHSDPWSPESGCTSETAEEAGRVNWGLRCGARPAWLRRRRGGARGQERRGRRGGSASAAGARGLGSSSLRNQRLRVCGSSPPALSRQPSELAGHGARSPHQRVLRVRRAGRRPLRQQLDPPGPRAATLAAREAPGAGRFAFVGGQRLYNIALALPDADMSQPQGCTWPSRPSAPRPQGAHPPGLSAPRRTLVRTGCLFATRSPTCCNPLSPFVPASPPPLCPRLFSASAGGFTKYNSQASPPENLVSFIWGRLASGCAVSCPGDSSTQPWLRTQFYSTEFCRGRFDLLKASPPKRLRYCGCFLSYINILSKFCLRNRKPSLYSNL